MEEREHPKRRKDGEPEKFGDHTTSVSFPCVACEENGAAATSGNKHRKLPHASKHRRRRQQHFGRLLSLIRTGRHFLIRKQEETAAVHRRLAAARQQHVAQRRRPFGGLGPDSSPFVRRMRHKIPGVVLLCRSDTGAEPSLAAGFSLGSRSCRPLKTRSAH